MSTRADFWAVCAAGERAAVNAFGLASGWGANNLHMPLSASGLAPATHYGGHLNSLLKAATDDPAEAGEVTGHALIEAKLALGLNFDLFFYDKTQETAEEALFTVMGLKPIVADILAPQ